MDAKTKKLLIAVIAVILLLAVALVALKLTEPSEGGETSVTNTAEVTSKLLYQKSPDAVTSLEIENSYGEFSIIRGADGVLGVDGYDEVALYTSYVDYLTEKSSSLISQKVIEENAADLDKYGLKNPNAKVTVTFSNGDKRVLRIGNSIPQSTTECMYFCFDGEKTVYSVLASSVSVYTVITKPSLISTLVTAVPETDANGKFPIVRELNIERADLPYSICMNYDSVKGSHTMTLPVELKLTETTKYILPNGLYGIVAMSAVRYPVSEKDLETAGLAEPSGVLTMKSDAGDVKLIIGKKMTAEDGSVSYLAMVDGVEIIYQISSDVLPWMSIDISDIAVSYVYKAVADDISNISITADGKTDKFSKTGTYTDDDAAVKWNGKETDAQNLLTLYKYLFAFRFESISNDETLVTGEPVAEIEVKCYDGTVETLKYYDIGNKECAVTYNGKMSFICRKAYVDRLVQNLELLENGEELVMTW